MKEGFWYGKRGVGIDDTLKETGPETVIDVIEQAFQEYASQDCFTAMGKTLSYAEVDKLSLAFAAYIQKNTNLQPGDRIAIQMPSSLQYIVALYGALRAGLVIVNTNPMYTAREMKHQFQDSGAKALVYMNLYGGLVEKVLFHTQIEHLIECTLGDLLDFPKRQLLNVVAKYIKKAVPQYSLPKSVPFRGLLREGSQLKYLKVKTNPEDLCMLQYTGGTTGVAKGAMLLNKNLIAQSRQTKAIQNGTDRKGERVLPVSGAVMICPLPLYHIYAFSTHCMAAFSMGHHSVLITDPRNTRSFIQTLRQWKFNSFTGINTLFISLMEDPDFKSVNFSNLKFTGSGGAALSKATAKHWHTLTGCHISEGYGLTEASPSVSINPADGQGKLGTIGMPLPGTTVKTIDDNGVELGFDEPGELCVKGPQVMHGYWRRPDATNETIVDGWLHTGDIAEITDDGYIRIVDRKKDMILVSGFNVFPNEIEEVVTSHPKVELCACIGVEDSKSGEAPKIFVVRSDGSLTEDELKKHCSQNLTAYKRPKHYVFTTELPMTAVGKVLRKELRQQESTA